MKAEIWLSMQNLPVGFDVQKLQEEAMQENVLTVYNTTSLVSKEFQLYWMYRI